MRSFNGKPQATEMGGKPQATEMGGKPQATEMGASRRRLVRAHAVACGLPFNEQYTVLC